MAIILFTHQIQSKHRKFTIFRQIERELDRYDEMHEVKTQLPTMHQNITTTKKLPFPFPLQTSRSLVLKRSLRLPSIELLSVGLSLWAYIFFICSVNDNEHCTELEHSILYSQSSNCCFIFIGNIHHVINSLLSQTCHSNPNVSFSNFSLVVDA